MVARRNLLPVQDEEEGGKFVTGSSSASSSLFVFWAITDNVVTKGPSPVSLWLIVDSLLIPSPAPFSV